MSFLDILKSLAILSLIGFVVCPFVMWVADHVIKCWWSYKVIFWQTILKAFMEKKGKD